MLIYKLFTFCATCKWFTDVTADSPPYRCEVCGQCVESVMQRVLDRTEEDTGAASDAAPDAAPTEH